MLSWDEFDEEETTTTAAPAAPQAAAAANDADGPRDVTGHDRLPPAAVRALRAAQDRAELAEDLAKGLQEKLSQAELSVRMLRQQLYKETHGTAHGHGHGARSASASAAVRPKQLPGRRYAPTKLPKLATVNDENDGNGAPLANAADDTGGPPMPMRRPKPQWDPVCTDVDTPAFPNYGGKSRSGLKAKPKVGGPIEV